MICFTSIRRRSEVRRCVLLFGYPPNDRYPSSISFAAIRLKFATIGRFFNSVSPLFHLECLSFAERKQSRRGFPNRVHPPVKPRPSQATATFTTPRRVFDDVRIESALSSPVNNQTAAQSPRMPINPSELALAYCPSALGPEGVAASNVGFSCCALNSTTTAQAFCEDILHSQGLCRHI